MSIPLDNLYDFFEGISDSNLVIYRWQQHGSKKLEDCVKHNCIPTEGTNDFIKSWITPAIIFHDQEPLDYNLYNQKYLEKWLKSHRPNISGSKKLSQLMQSQNIRAALAPNQYNRVLLVHSEIGGTDLVCYGNNGFIPVYVWSHALIARDWYRYAQYDQRLNKSNQELLFNVHARAWTGSREYRLKFLDRLAATNLHKISRVNLGDSDDKKMLVNYEFDDKQWSCDTAALSSIYNASNDFNSSASGSYSIDEYNKTKIDVVLETMFEKQRIHLTEKTLRCLACARPFVLLSGPGSLSYLKHYGFETFQDVWDETYDEISDPELRMLSIISSLKKISKLDWNKISDKISDICQHNQQRFFSNSFFEQVISEYKENLQSGLTQLVTECPGTLWQQMYQIGQEDNFVGQWFNRVIDKFELSGISQSIQIRLL